VLSYTFNLLLFGDNESMFSLGALAFLYGIGNGTGDVRFLLLPLSNLGVGFLFRLGHLLAGSSRAHPSLGITLRVMFKVGKNLPLD